MRLKGSEKLKFENGADFALWTRTLSHDDVKRIYEARDGSPHHYAG